MTMLRKILIATTLLAASGTALASQTYVHGRVVSVDPSFAVSYGSGAYNSGFSVMYSSGGVPYWGTPYGYGPAPVIVVPPPHYRVYSVPPGHAYKHGYGPGRGHGGKGSYYRNDRHDSYRDHRRDDRRHDRY